MSAPETARICVTSPIAGTRRWVFLDPPTQGVTRNRCFDCATDATAYAAELSAELELPISERAIKADNPPCQMPFDRREDAINQLLWVMAASAPAEQTERHGPMFWAAAARQNAEIIINSGNTMSPDDRAVLVAIGGAMLSHAAVTSGQVSPDDVLGQVMVCGSL